MPLDLSCETDDVLTLDEYTAHIETIDLSDRAAVLATAPKLKALANNKTFLVDHIIEQVAAKRRKGSRPGAYIGEYTPNVFILAIKRGFAVRAVIWPTAGTALTESAKELFSFELAHDHNFDFMTVGYFGPGYETDLFEYDFAKVVGYPGEPVDLSPIGRWQLDPGRVLFFRKNVDIHTQLPPPSTSISLNLMLSSGDYPTPQYTFDLNERTLIKNIQFEAQARLVETACLLADDPLLDRVVLLAASHGKPEVRLASYRALERRRGSQVWEPALADASELIRHLARQALR